MVGFNRRFAPQILKVRALLSALAEPKSFVMTVNAGQIPLDHWTQDPAIGGGRLIGEGCHFIDLLRHLAGAPVVDQHTTAMGRRPGVIVRDDKVSISLVFADGSTGVVHYLSNGHKSFPKERLEVFVGGRVLQLDNFRKLRGWGWENFSSMNLWSQDKGNGRCAAAFVDAVRDGNPAPIPLDEILEVSRVTIQASQAIAR
jgi:predicted dehydrogenase